MNAWTTKGRPMTMIQLEGVSKHFGDVQALKGLDMSVNEGEIYGFLGRNGVWRRPSGLG